MKKCIFIRVLILILSIGLGCTTIPQMPKEGIISSTNTPATGTPDDRYQALIGEWRGSYRVTGEGGYAYWFSAILIIHEIDIANAKARCTFSADIEGEYSGQARVRDNVIRADFIAQPSPKIKWEIRSGRGQYEFVIKGNVLEGTMTGLAYLTREGAPVPPPRTVKMEKQIKE